MTEQERGIQQRADKLMRDLGIEKTTRVPIIQVAKQLGLYTYEWDDMPSKLNGAMYLNVRDENVLQSVDGRDSFIIVNDMMDVEHKRFTVAHEIGHFILHRGENDSFLVYHQVEDEEEGIEGEASKFAAMLLMNEDVFKQKYYELKVKGIEGKKDIIQNLRIIFCVPWRAVERRIQELELSL